MSLKIVKQAATFRHVVPNDPALDWPEPLEDDATDEQRDLYVKLREDFEHRYAMWLDGKGELPLRSGGGKPAVFILDRPGASSRARIEDRMSQGFAEAAVVTVKLCLRSVEDQPGPDGSAWNISHESVKDLRQVREDDMSVLMDLGVVGDLAGRVFREMAPKKK